MKGMVQRQKFAVFSLGIEFSIKHSLFAFLVRHSALMLNDLMRNDLMVERDNREIKTSTYLIVFWSVDAKMTTNIHVFSLIGSSDEVIVLAVTVWVF